MKILLTVFVVLNLFYSISLTNETEKQLAFTILKTELINKQLDRITSYLESNNFDESIDAVEYLKQYHLKLTLKDMILVKSDFSEKFRIYCMNSFSVHPEKYIIIIDNKSQIFLISGFAKNHFNKLFQKGLISVKGNKKLISSIIDLYVKTAMTINQDEEYLNKTLQIKQTKNEFIVEFQTKSFMDDRIHNYKLKLNKYGIQLLNK